MKIKEYKRDKVVIYYALCRYLVSIGLIDSTVSKSKIITIFATKRIINEENFMCEGNKENRLESIARQLWGSLIPSVYTGKGEKSFPIPKKEDSQNIKSNDFLFSYAWRKLRLQVLMKYGSKCACCGITPKDGAVMNVDHIKPRSKYPELALDFDNLQALCNECNHGKGNWSDKDFRLK